MRMMQYMWLPGSLSNEHAISDHADWRHMAVDAPFNYVGEELRAKMEVASKPQEKAEEEDTEGVDLMLAVRMNSKGFPRTDELKVVIEHKLEENELACK